MSANDDGEPGGRAPAPGRLGLLQRFLNTADLEPGVETLPDAGSTAAWLRDVDLPTGHPPSTRSVTQADARGARELRESLRDLLRARTHPDQPLDTARLNHLLQRYPIIVALQGPGLVLRPLGVGVNAALAELLGIAVLTDADGSLVRLKICAENRCRWAFYDASRSRSGRWCTMAICGARTKARDYRRRHAQHTAP